MHPRLTCAARVIEGFQPDGTPILHSDGGVLVANSRVAERRSFARALFPHVRTFYDGYLAGVGDEPFYRGSGRV